MDLTVILALLQAASAMLPQLAAALPAVERLVSGNGTQDDIDALQVVTAALNEQAQAAEQRVIDQGGTGASGE